MGVLEYLLNGMTVLVAESRKDEEMRIDIVRVRKRGKELQVEEFLQDAALGGWENKKRKDPVLLLVRGHGIIRKVFQAGDMEGMERITGNDDFIWGREEGSGGESVLCFTRQDRVVDLLEVMRKEGLPVVETRLISPGEENVDSVPGIALKQVKQFYGEGIGWKRLVSGGRQGDLLAGVIAGKVKLPLLMCLLGLLFVNYLWNDSVRTRYADQQMEIASLEHDVSGREKLSRDMERVISEFKGNGSGRFSPVLDRIASVVPAEISLETMTVNPLLKSIEEKKALVTRDGYVELTGVTDDPANVSVFTGKLSGQDFARRVKLASLDKNRETGRFHFKIWVSL